MITTKLARKVLTDADQRHLKRVGVRSMKEFLICRKGQIERQNKIGMSSCPQCNEIATKLGID